MPRLSTSDRAKARVEQLLRGLLTYANHEREDFDAIGKRLSVRWSDEANKPWLLVQTQLSALVELVFPGARQKDAKELIRHDLRLLKEFLNILEDHRVKTQGNQNWHFTLHLWSRSTQSNLEEFEQEWQRCKKARSAKSTNDGVRHSANSIEENDVGNNRAEKITFRSSIHMPGSISATSQSKSAYLLHNLPACAHTAFIGSQPYVAKLLKLLAVDHPATLISIEGIGGIGKTTLTLEIAHRCRKAAQNPEAFPEVPIFNAIIFTSAKPYHFVGSKLSQRLKVESSLQDILRVILRTFHVVDGIPPSLRQQLEFAQDYLAQQRTLLIVDNLETLEEQEHILSLLCELPATVKVILTSRVRLGIGTALSLDCLSLEDGLALIQHYAQEKDVPVSPAQAQAIYQQAGGLPLAIAYAMGKMAVYGAALDPEATDLVQSSDEFMRYCFEQSIQPLRGQPAHALLMALTLFAQSASPEALESVAFVAQNADLTSANAVREGLAILHRLSLIEPRQEYYGLHPLTRHYVDTELSMYPDFEHDARSRLVTWYLNFLEPYGAKNWRDWQEFAPLEQEWENLCGVMEWCKTTDRYDDFRQFWQQLKGYTQLYGHWHERLDWMDWLTEAATQRQDTATLADALYHASRTLYLFNQPEQTQRAIELCQQAWELAQLQENWMLQVDLTIHLAALCSQQQQFEQAIGWLNQGETLLQQFAQGHQTELHQWIDIDYYRAEIYLENDVQHAKQLYTAALEKAERVGWQRAIAYIKGGLAAVAVAEGNLPEAKQLLDFVLLQARQHNDKRCISFCQKYLAVLEKARGNLLEAQRWAQSAKNGFEQLKMQDKAIEMDSLID
jgi:hypothetical protein